MNELSLLGIAIVFLANVFLGPGEFEDVRVGWGGMDHISQTHLLDITSATQSDNYIVDSKNEENPRYSTLSVRPGFSTYLTTGSTAGRGLFHYLSPGGDDLMIACNTTSILKQGLSSWTTLQSGLYDSPWEGYLYTDPDVTRLYLCNGLNTNYKYISSQDRLMPMQNQDDEVTIGGTVWFTALSTTATGNAVAIASLEAGNYIKYSTAGTDDEWNEIVSIEGTTLIFSSLTKGLAGSYSLVVRSSNIARSRYIQEFEGHIVTAYSSVETSTPVSNSATAESYYYFDGNFTTGIAQSFVAASNSMNILRVKGMRFDSYEYSGNLIIKIKSSLTATSTIAKITYPVASLPTTQSNIDFNFGSIPLTIGGTYYWTIERENSSAIMYGYFVGGTAVTGQVYWTYNSSGFDSSWNTGVTTIDVQPRGNINDPYYNFNNNFESSASGYLDAANPTTDNTSLNPIRDVPLLYVGGTPATQRKSLLFSYAANWGNTLYAKNEWISAKLKLYKKGSVSGNVTAYKRLPPYGITAVWDKTIAGWYLDGCSSAESDFTNTGKVAITVPTAEGWVTFEVSGIANTWTKQISTNNGLLISSDSTAQITFIGDSSAEAYKPIWSFTAVTGSQDANSDLYFEIIKQSGQRSTVNYSKRYKPENFPTLNTFQIPGRVVGLAKSGGYLIVAGKNPDALNIYRETGDTTDGLGIDFVTRINNITFGSSKSIAYLPKEDSFIFYSGLGVYKQLGLQTRLLSGKIREEAKLFGSYRDPAEYYAGSANNMPQATVLPTKDLYLLSAVNNQYIYAYNYANDTWVRWTGITPEAMVVRESGGSEPQLYYTDNTGQTYTMDTSGSTTTEAVLEWFFSGKDITKDKQLNLIEIWARADNPLTNCLVTLEVNSIDRSPNSRTFTFTPDNNATTDKMVKIACNPAIKSKEFKIRLTQKAIAGALSLRTIRYKYQVE